MSVLIKGMDMPHDCVGCPFVVREMLMEYKGDGVSLQTRIYNCTFRPDEIEDGWIGFNEATRSKQSWCPLVEVPTPHGRLADCDAVRECIEEVVGEDKQYALMLLDLAVSKRTIIEAEE